MPRRPLLLLDCYLDPEGAWGFFAPWLQGAEVVRAHVAAGERPAPPDRYSGVVITGSAASVYDEAPWSRWATGYTADAVRAGIPLLGVCYGHQLLGEAVGGRGTVRPAARPEVGYLDVELDRGDPLFDALPERFTSFLTHGDELRATPAFEVWGRSALCPIQAIRVPGRPAWGVQFHNEYPPEEQLRLLRMRAARHPELGLDPEAAFAARTDTAPLARALFGRFLEVCGWR